MHNRTPMPTAADIKAYRDKHEVGMADSKRALEREWRCARLREIRNSASELYTVEACQNVIQELLQFLIEAHNG